MGKIILSILLFSSILSCTDNQETTKLDFSVKVASATSIKAFKNTVQPVLIQHCSSCHGNGGTAIKHSVSNSQVAHDVIVDGGKVNFASPASSRLVEKMLKQNHNCWGGDCAESANIMLAAIKKWIEIRGVSVGTIGSFVTDNLQYQNSVSRLVKPINGFMVLQAEDGDLVGRMKAKPDDRASNFTYISGRNPSPHPDEDTERVGTINTNEDNQCRIMSTADLAKKTGGRYQIREQARHVNQSGNRYYTQRIRFRIIRPDARERYRDLLAKETEQTILTMQDVEHLFLKAGAKTQDGGIDDYDGNTVIDVNDADNNLRIAPELPVQSRTRAATEAIEGFYGRNPEYFLATNREIRQKLNKGIKQAYVFQNLYKTIRDHYFELNDQNVSVPKLSTSAQPAFLRSFLVEGGDISNKLVQASGDEAVSEPDNLGIFNGHMQLRDSAGALVANSILNIDNAIVEIQSGIDNIDTYVYYYMLPGDRDTDARADLTINNLISNPSLDAAEVDANPTVNSPLVVQYDNSNPELDLTSLYTRPGVIDTTSIEMKNFAETLHVTVRNNVCINCHGKAAGEDPVNAPRYASSNVFTAFTNAYKRVNFKIPEQSRFLERMDEGHNCGGPDKACDIMKAELLGAINSWNTKNIADIAIANEANIAQPIALSDQDKTIGRVKFPFEIDEAGDYNLWMKVKDPDDSTNFKVRVLDSAGRPREYCGAQQNCGFDLETYNEDGDDLDNLHCSDFNAASRDAWTWFIEGGDNLANRKKWQLEKGEYTLEIIEQDINAQVDMIALSKNPEFHPGENLIDESVILSAKPRLLSYDISKYLGGDPGFFEIEVVVKNGGDSYQFRNPQFVGLTQNIKVGDIKLLINDTYEFANSSFTKLSAVVGPEPRILTFTSLIALTIAGVGNDTFKFAFGELRPTEAGLTKREEDIPAIVENRKCLESTLFENTVKPILNEFKLMRKKTNPDDNNMIGYRHFVEDNRLNPGVNRNERNNPTIYTCTTCHTDDHPYFKMTNFRDNKEKFCAQALSRVDFGNYERSLILRGINGTFNHPPLHFLQQVELTEDRFGFLRNPADDAYVSKWLGRRFETYSETDITKVDGETDNNAYLDKWVGKYKRVAYNKITDINSTRFDDVQLVGDTQFGKNILRDDVPVNDENILANWLEPSNLDRWTYSTDNTEENPNQVITPATFLAAAVADRVDPESITDGGLIKVVACTDVESKQFVTEDGVLKDNCIGNSVNIDSEFEAAKTTYRNAVINWMKAEATAYKACLAATDPVCSPFFDEEPIVEE